jgi:dCMP deaminase
VQWDHYYMEIALTVRRRANCWGAKVGAVLVLGNRIISTGFNGTPADFVNCRDGGCVRCRDRELGDLGRMSEVSDPSLASGPKQLDLCICVHAEANALLSAARVGTPTEGATLYATHTPCFACLKEAYQAGVKRVVWLYEWEPADSPSLKQQYNLLAEHLSDNNTRNFEQLAPQSKLVAETATELREPVLDEHITRAEPNGDEPDKKLAKSAGTPASRATKKPKRARKGSSPPAAGSRSGAAKAKPKPKSAASSSRGRTRPAKRAGKS